MLGSTTGLGAKARANLLDNAWHSQGHLELPAQKCTSIYEFYSINLGCQAVGGMRCDGCIIALSSMQRDSCPSAEMAIEAPFQQRGIK